MMPIGSSNLQVDRLMAQLRASPAKATVLAGLSIILAGVCFRAMTNTSPTAVRAASIEGSSQGHDSIVDATANKNSETDSLQRWSRQPVRVMDRNVFLVPLDSYPRDGSKISGDSRQGTGFWDHIAKSMSSRADQQEQRQILIDNVKIAAGTLKLQSTMFGDESTAIINGELVHEGSKIGTFRVVKIEMGRVIVEREGIHLGLQMN
jgi:hypothetical protein